MYLHDPIRLDVSANVASVGNEVFCQKENEGMRYVVKEDVTVLSVISYGKKCSGE